MCQVVYNKVGLIICHFAEVTDPIDDIEDLLYRHYLVPSVVSYEVDSSIVPTFQTGSGVTVPHTRPQNWEVEEPAVKPRAV